MSSSVITDWIQIQIFFIPSTVQCDEDFKEVLDIANVDLN